MKDRRSVNGLSIEELERVLLIKRREKRLARLRQMDQSEHLTGRDPLAPDPPPPMPTPIPTGHRQFKGVGASAGYHSVEVDAKPGQSFGSRLNRQLSAALSAVQPWLANVNWRFVFNRVFLLIEVSAVVGLIFITVGAWQDRRKINQEAEKVYSMPTTAPPTRLAPTPTTALLINAVILPGGHTPPDAQGFSQPEPIPEHLQALAAAITPQPVPTLGPEHTTRIVIPSISVDHPVVEGDDWEVLKQGVGHTPWSANPGENGNCILVAHNDIFGEIFRRLPEIELGDDIFVHTRTQVYRYQAKATHIVEPTQVEMLYPTNHPALTLISSYPYLEDKKRIVVIAELEL
jgi:sortase A